jgi:hypothetical protein
MSLVTKERAIFDEVRDVGGPLAISVVADGHVGGGFVGSFGLVNAEDFSEGVSPYLPDGGRGDVRVAVLVAADEVSFGDLIVPISGGSYESVLADEGHEDLAVAYTAVPASWLGFVEFHKDILRRV